MKNHRFSPPWWAKNPHIQTILPVLTKIKPLKLHRQRRELKDGDFIDLDWLGTAQDKQPIVVILHGLEGSSNSHYARRILHACQQHNLCAVVHHHRSCSGSLNRLARCYHSGDTQDIHDTLTQLKQRYPNSPLWAIGYSLGGNVLAKYQGEHQEDSLLDRCVTVSAPLHLAACAKRLESGASTIYQSYLIKQLQKKMQAKVDNPELAPLMPVLPKSITQLKTFYDFDHQLTAPLHGFDGADDYYTRASGLPFLATIRKPTLVIHAKDDPFMTDDVIPSASQLSPQVHYELHPNGGHVGFINGGSPWKPRYYLEQRIIDFLTTKETSSC